MNTLEGSPIADVESGRYWPVYSSAEEVSSVVVIGNGPSLRGVDLPALGDTATIGLNAAYRHWERIGWHPTYYCCLDEIVVESHVDAIVDLLVSRKVKGAFLSGRFFELCPQFDHDERLLNLDTVSQHWFERRGRERGLSYVWHPAFASCYPLAITTGAWATRWASFLGYQAIYLIGFDLTYVDSIDGSEPAGGTKVRMARTPERNPNYFFDDYQQEGDAFQIANPNSEAEPLHEHAFAVIPHDFSVRRVMTHVFNGQPGSGLSRLDAFPVRPVPCLPQMAEAGK